MKYFNTYTTLGFVQLAFVALNVPGMQHGSVFSGFAAGLCVASAFVFFSRAVLEAKGNNR